MSLLFDNDVELPSDPPLYPLVDDSRYQPTLGLNSLLRDLPLVPQPVPGERNDSRDTAGPNTDTKLPIPDFINTATSQPEMNRSAFRAVGSHDIVNSPAVKPGAIPLAPGRSPQISRRLDSSDQETVSPTPSSTASESHPPTPAKLGPFCWPAHSEENRQLLGTEEESSDRQSSDEEEEEEEEKNIWLITKEQMSYYMTQFKSMQPNPLGVIPGTQAKEFFEKSRLPILELRKIWQLSDVTKDGCLSLEEFLTAMHLVVLRRNDITLPDELPLCLKPSNLKDKIIDRHNNKDLYDGNPRPLLDGTETDSLDFSLPNDSIKVLDTDSAVSPESLLSSPGRPKPVKFDFNAVDASKDPNIACPVPLRLSPDSPRLQSSEEDSPQTIGRQPPKGKRGVVYEQLWNNEDLRKGLGRSSSSSSSSSSNSNLDTEGEEMEPLSSSPDIRSGGPVSLPYLQNSDSTVRTGVLGLQKKEGLPPSPPPRPSKTHARSSSLDLAQLNKRTAPILPFIPPRASPGRKTSDSTEELETSGRDVREISANIHKYKESVALLTRTVTELNQEVSDIMEERVVLEYQLEQLKSFGNQD